MNLNLNQPEDNVGGEGGQIKTDVATFHSFTRSHGVCSYLKHVGTVVPNFTSFNLFLSLNVVSGSCVCKTYDKFCLRFYNISKNNNSKWWSSLCAQCWPSCEGIVFGLLWIFWLISFIMEINSSMTESLESDLVISGQMLYIWYMECLLKQFAWSQSASPKIRNRNIALIKDFLTGPSVKLLCGQMISTTSAQILHGKYRQCK